MTFDMTPSQRARWQREAEGPFTLFYTNQKEWSMSQATEIRSFKTLETAINYACERLGVPGFYDPMITVNGLADTLFATVELERECRRRLGA